MLFMFNHYQLRMSDNFSLAPDLDCLATVSFDIRKLKQNFEKTKTKKFEYKFWTENICLPQCPKPQETSWEINYKLRQDFKVEHSGKEIRISFIALPHVTLNMFRMTVWTISMESLWRPHRSKYPDKQGWCCLLCGQHSLTTASINYRVSRKLFVKRYRDRQTDRPPHFCSRELHTNQFVL